MSTTPYLPLAVPDFVADTMEMTTKEVGAYMLILMSLWQRKGYLPNDQAKIKRVARVGRDWPKIWEALSPHFEVEGDRIFNAKLLAIVTRVADQRAVNARSGARGGRAKALKDKKARLANATISPWQLEPEDKEREANASPKKKRKTGTRLPEDWMLPRDWGEWAISQGWSEPVVRDQAERFRDYWIAKSGKDGTKLDWEATWRNWMRNSKAQKLTTIAGGQDGRPASKSENRVKAFIAGATQSP